MAGVGHFDDHPALLTCSGDLQHPTVRRRHRLAGVEKQIEQDLLKLKPIRPDGKRLVHVDRQPNPVLAQITTKARNGVIDRRPHRYGLTFGQFGCTDLQHAVRHRNQHANVVEGDRQGFPLKCSIIGIEGSLGVSKDRGKKIVDLMGDHSRSHSEAVELLRLPHLSLEQVELSLEAAELLSG